MYQTEPLQMCKTMVFVKEGLQFPLFPGMSKIDPKSDKKTLKIVHKVTYNADWDHTKKTLTKNCKK